MARLTKSDLLASLRQAAVPCHEIDVPGGGCAVAMQRGARLIGLFPDDSPAAPNALWTNDRFDDILRGSVRDWEGKGVGGPGGERLWVSPERRFYYRDPDNFEDWFCPFTMDPGLYEPYDDPDAEVAWRNTFELSDMMHGRTYHGVTISRRFRPLENPYANEAVLAQTVSRLRYAGVRKIDSIELPGAPADTEVSLWTLALVNPLPPKGVGTVVIPVRRSAEPVDYFGGLTGERLVVCDDHVAFRVDGRSIGKLGIRPENIVPERSAKVAAFLPAPDPDRLLLVLQRSSDVPRRQQDCLDVAKVDPGGPKGVLQAYNHGPGDDRRKRYPKFGEIEIQLTAARPEGKGLSARAISDLLAFEGPREDVIAFGTAILDIRELHIFA